MWAHLTFRVHRKAQALSACVVLYNDEGRFENTKTFQETELDREEHTASIQESQETESVNEDHGADE